MYTKKTLIWQVDSVSIQAEGLDNLFIGVARNLFWGGIKVLGRYKTLILVFNNCSDVISIP